MEIVQGSIPFCLNNACYMPHEVDYGFDYWDTTRLL